MLLENKDAIATLAVKDAKVAKQFYEGKLGLKLLDDEEPGTLTYKAGKLQDLRLRVQVRRNQPGHGGQLPRRRRGRPHREGPQVQGSHLRALRRPAGHHSGRRRARLGRPETRVAQGSGREHPGPAQSVDRTCGPPSVRTGQTRFLPFWHSKCPGCAPYERGRPSPGHIGAESVRERSRTSGEGSLPDTSARKVSGRGAYLSGKALSPLGKASVVLDRAASREGRSVSPPVSRPKLRIRGTRWIRRPGDMVEGVYGIWEDASGIGLAASSAVAGAGSGYGPEEAGGGASRGGVAGTDGSRRSAEGRWPCGSSSGLAGADTFSGSTQGGHTGADSGPSFSTGDASPSGSAGSPGCAARPRVRVRR